MLALCWSLCLGTSAAAWLTILLDKPDTAVWKIAPYLSSIRWPKLSLLVSVYASNGGVISWHWKSMSTRSLLSGKGFTSGAFACWPYDPPRSSASWIGSDVLDPLVSWSSVLNWGKTPPKPIWFFLRKVNLSSGECEMSYKMSPWFSDNLFTCGSCWTFFRDFFFRKEVVGMALQLFQMLSR